MEPSPLPRPAIRPLALFLAVALAGCLPALPRTSPAAAPAFDAVAFFEGRTAGLGTLTIRTRRPQVVRVESVGTRTSDGGLSLVQSVRLGDEAPSERTWALRPDGPGRWTGTLTDADGAVEAWAEGTRLWIRYSMPGGLSMRQELTLEPGGALALNLATVRFWGIPIARLTEQIRRPEPRPGSPGIGRPDEPGPLTPISHTSNPIH